MTVFGVALCGALLNVHFFQSETAGHRFARAEMGGSKEMLPDALKLARLSPPSDQWRARLRRRGLPAARAVKTGAERVVSKRDFSRAENRLDALTRSDKSGIGQITTNQPVARISKLVRAVQRELTSRGYEPGPVDGIDGLMTRAAIMAFQHDRGMAVSGRPTEALLKQLVLGDSLLAMPDTETGQGVENRRRITRTVQLRLKSLGYGPGAANGLMSKDTRDAIKEFEKYSGLVETGRVSGRLIGKLSRAPKLRLGSTRFSARRY